MYKTQPAGQWMEKEGRKGGEPQLTVRKIICFSETFVLLKLYN